MTDSKELELIGIPGDNILGFLAAIGTIQTLTRCFTSSAVCMSWRRAETWYPVLHFDTSIAAEEVVERINNFLSGSENPERFTLGYPVDKAPDNLTLTPTQFKSVCRLAIERASKGDRSLADFCAALGTDTIYDDKSMRDTAFRTMSGSGHQHFLQFMRRIAQNTAAEHIHKTLFAQWKYDDAVASQTMRWDPIDDVWYALRSRDPSGDPERNKRGSMLGANRLAIEALSLFPTAPTARALLTTGFIGRGSRDTYFHWPIWEGPIGLLTIRSILSLRSLLTDTPDKKELRQRGVLAVYRSQRLSIDKRRCFSVAREL